MKQRLYCDGVAVLCGEHQGGPAVELGLIELRPSLKLTGKYRMASAYAERVGTAYGGAWALREIPGSQDLQRSFAAQLKQHICSARFAEMLTRIAEQSGDRSICEMLMRRQHDMLHQYCDSVLGASVPTKESAQ